MSSGSGSSDLNSNPAGKIRFKIFLFSIGLKFSLFFLSKYAMYEYGTNMNRTTNVLISVLRYLLVNIFKSRSLFTITFHK